jgi:hypothetical protein
MRSMARELTAPWLYAQVTTCAIFCSAGDSIPILLRALMIRRHGEGASGNRGRPWRPSPAAAALPCPQHETGGDGNGHDPDGEPHRAARLFTDVGVRAAQRTGGPRTGSYRTGCLGVGRPRRHRCAARLRTGRQRRGACEVPPDPGHRHPDRLDVVRIGVVDKSRALPVRRVPADAEERGRGLIVVDALAERWGTELRRWGKSGGAADGVGCVCGECSGGRARRNNAHDSSGTSRPTRSVMQCSTTAKHGRKPRPSAGAPG